MKKDNLTTQNLIRARDLLLHGWIQGHFCSTRFGRYVEPSDPEACYFCALGAIAKITGTSSLRAYKTPEAAFLAQAIGKRKEPFQIVNWNDTAHYDEVIKAFNSAIVRSRGAHRRSLIKDTPDVQAPTESRST